MRLATPLKLGKRRKKGGNGSRRGKGRQEIKQQGHVRKVLKEKRKNRVFQIYGSETTHTHVKTQTHAHTHKLIYIL